MNTNVDRYFTDGCGRCPLGGTPQCKVNSWKMELEHLRFILHECGLKEESKWGVPCYTFENHNLIILAAFKDYCALSFFKGALLKDKNNLLQKPGENTQAARVIRFKSVQEIVKLKPILKTYILEAIDIEKAGLKVPLKKINEFAIPDEFQQKLDAEPKLQKAFRSLTPGRQRAYLIYFSAPKQTSTRLSRVEKCLPLIRMGKGLND